MDYLRKKRYGYFLIWGNGIQYKKRILEIIRKEKYVNIIRIQKYKPKSIKKFVRDVYSYDYAPFEHLEAKTRYLLKTSPNLIFIFFINKEPQERYFGEGRFRHIECERIKKLKEKLRNKFNPKIDNIRTEEHVVHASDNEKQTDYILKYLGFKLGIRTFKKNQDSILSIPYYLSEIKEFKIKTIKLSQLFCNILKEKKGTVYKEAVKIEDTPHFACLNGKSEPYQIYLEKHLGNSLTCNYSIKKFIKLSKNFNYLKYPYTNNYIITKRTQNIRYLILDGVHRASILKFNKIERSPIVILK